MGQGSEGWDPHGPHLCGQLVLMAFVVMLALRLGSSLATEQCFSCHSGVGT